MSTSDAYRVRFLVPSGNSIDARLQNLSAGGFSVEISMADTALLELGSPIGEILLDHPDLPMVPLGGVVVRILGKVPGKLVGYALVGIEFTSITPFIQELINDHVVECLK